MSEPRDILADALKRLQRRIKPAGSGWFCTECGKGWAAGTEERHWPTCATGIARAARVAAGMEP